MKQAKPSKKLLLAISKKASDGSKIVLVCDSSKHAFKFLNVTVELVFTALLPTGCISRIYDGKKIVARRFYIGKGLLIFTDQDSSYNSYIKDVKSIRLTNEVQLCQDKATH